MNDFNWRCPFCDHNAAITAERWLSQDVYLEIANAEGPRYFTVFCIVCPNKECRRFTLDVIMREFTKSQMGHIAKGKEIRRWNLIPSARMRVLPKYVPRPIVQDYEEACLIAELSPKASATLARRCLQGIIRDFWGIAKDKLSQEIDALKDKVENETWKAIDATRKIGNIGAHMEKDINIIVDVDPDEAQHLIKLIEILIQDWYVARQRRRESLLKVKEIGDAKEVQRKEPTASPNSPT